MVKRLYILIILIICCRYSTVYAIDTSTTIFHPQVRSLLLRCAEVRFATPDIPVINLDNQRLTVEFDMLEEDRRYLRYDITHCNADWQPSGLAYIEYLDGFNEGVVEDYSFSMGTTVHYVHYRLTLPNEQTRLLKSGNYLLRVYDESSISDEDVLFQCRFCVSEQTAVVAAGLTSATDNGYRSQWQQLDLHVDLQHANVRDPFNDIIVVIEQNGRPDTRRILPKPSFITSENNAHYEHLPQLIYEAGNEYRRFETISTTFGGMNVDAVQWISPYYNMWLTEDVSRAGESYHYDETLSGAYVVREYNADDSDTQADYVVVHFSLDYPELTGMDIFIDGNFVQRKFGSESKMIFNRATNRYEKALLLKQGAYSYQYLAVPHGTSTGRTSVIEGNKYETTNHYTIYVYHRQPNERYDRLVGVTRL